MRRIVNFLIPKEDKFFDMLTEEAANALDCDKKFDELIANYDGAQPEKRAEMIKEIKALEDKGDRLTHAIIEGLNTTFITPIDREDIHKLAILLDDIVDGIDEIATILGLYKIKTINPQMYELAVIAIKSVAETTSAVKALRKMNGIKDILMLIQEYENQGDAKFSEAIADLLNNNKDAIEVIKLKDIYQHFEDLIDTCEEVAHILDNILVKHA
jgi:uncharacterized protein